MQWLKIYILIVTSRFALVIQCADCWPMSCTSHELIPVGRNFNIYHRANRIITAREFCLFCSHKIKTNWNKLTKWYRKTELFFFSQIITPLLKHQSPGDCVSCQCLFNHRLATSAQPWIIKMLGLLSCNFDGLCDPQMWSLLSMEIVLFVYGNCWTFLEQTFTE